MNTNNTTGYVIDTRTILLNDDVENAKSRESIAHTIQQMLLEQGEVAVSQKTVDYLVDLTIRFISDLANEAAFIHHNAATPSIKPSFVQHIVRDNPQMMELLTKYPVVPVTKK